MKRLLLVAATAILASGCVVHSAASRPVYGPAPVYAPPPAPAPAAVFWYHGQHFVPDELGGGWCYADGPHRHDYAPDRVDAYELNEGYYYYRGPYVFSYHGGHPVPGRGWCYVRGPHTHEYFPPDGADFAWNRGRGWTYRGAWRPNRPPPASYWPAVRAPRPTPAHYEEPRPAPPRPGYGDVRPAPRPAPYPAPPARPVPGYERPAPAPVPAPYPPRGPGHSDDAPGHGNLPPGHGGTPPATPRRAGDAAPARRAPAPAPYPTPNRPGRSGDAPGHGNPRPARAARLRSRFAPAQAPTSPAGGAPARAARLGHDSRPPQAPTSPATAAAPGHGGTPTATPRLPFAGGSRPDRAEPRGRDDERGNGKRNGRGRDEQDDDDGGEQNGRRPERR
jgi:hypothetical protein